MTVAGTFLQDIRYAARQLARTRLATITVVLTLSLCIGATASMSTLVDALLTAQRRISAGITTPVTSDVSPLAAWLATSVPLLIVLVTCANVANVQFVHVLARRRELAVREALGAPEDRLLRQLLTESALQTLVAASVGALLSLWLSRGIVRLAAVTPVAGDSLLPSVRVMIGTTLCGAVSGVVLGIIPALRSDPAMPVGRGHLAFTRACAVVQVALSILLVVTAVVLNGGVATSALTGAFGLLALLLSALGLYGATAHDVAFRAREIGIRRSLGARTVNVLALFVREGLWLAVVGLLAGLGASVVISVATGNFLFGMSGADSLALAGATILLCAVAALASVMPARRAAGGDPMDALRYD